MPWEDQVPEDSTSKDGRLWRDRDAYRRGYDAIDWKPLPPLPRRQRGPVARGELAVPHVITDTMPPANRQRSRTSQRRIAEISRPKSASCRWTERR
jgi:hypothetical protein